MNIKVTWPRLLVVLLLWAGATVFAAQEVLRVDSVIATGRIDVNGGVYANGQNVVNTSGQLVASRLTSTAVSQFSNDVPYLTPSSGLHADNLSTGTIPNARYAANVSRTDNTQNWTASQNFNAGAIYNAPLNFQDYYVLGSTAASIASAGATINPGSEAVVFVTPDGPGRTIATINGGVEGRVVAVCNAGDIFSFVTGGNIVQASGNIGFGTCTQMIHRSNFWWFL